MFYQEEFSKEEQVILEKYFSNIDKPVFALINLPEVVKGALFARYSRSPKSLRRLFLDEFLLHIEKKESNGKEESLLDVSRAEKLYDRVFNEYGDDSVAQLGGAHIACEQSSNILTKILEWSRLASYLEQSTRYIFYDQKLGDRYRYTIPSEILNSPDEAVYLNGMEELFGIYKKSLGELIPYFQKLFPKKSSDSNFVYNSTIRAQACDVARGVLPASTISNVGIFATGQSYELMIMRMRIHPLQEVRDCAEMMLTELRKKYVSVTYVDHHHVEPKIIAQLKKIKVKLIHDTSECTSVLIYDTFKKKLPEHSVFIAVCGAITDYMENRPIASKLLQVYDRQFALINATVLTYNIVGHQRKQDMEYLHYLVY